MGKILCKMRYILLFILCGVVMISLAACGLDWAESAANIDDEYFYVPEYITLNSEENGSYLSNFVLIGNDMYYCDNIYQEESKTYQQILCRYSLEDGSVNQTLIKASERGNITFYTSDGAGNIYTVMSVDSSEMVDEEGLNARIFLLKYNSQENVVLEKDITELINGKGEGAYIRDICVDEQNNIYICLNSSVLLFNSEGEEHGLVEDANDLFLNIFSGKDGMVYLCHNNTVNGGFLFSEIDFKDKKIGDSYKNIPGISGNISVGAEKDFLFHDGSKVYEYDLESETYEELFEWIDYDINGFDIRYIGLMEDGEIVAALGDAKTNLIELVKMNKVSDTIESNESKESNGGSANDGDEADDSTVQSNPDTQNVSNAVTEKEEVILGTMYYDYRLQNVVAAFNRESETHRITIKNYWDYGIDYDTAITNIQKDIISADNCPDILDLSQLNMEKLASIGVLEDLNPYLEQSALYSKEDFLDNALEGVTFDGKLAAIPTGFTLSTVVGKASEVGEEMGWSLKEMLAFAEEHPDSQLFQLGEQNGFIYDFIVYNQNAFIDWSSGECHFDSVEFKALLELVDKFPAEVEWIVNKAWPEEKKEGKILLEKVENISGFYNLQQYPALYGEEVTFIGFPTADGSVGCTMNFSNYLYGITTKSKHKDVAWAFIESYLTGMTDYNFEYPVLKDALQKQIDNIYWRDENGELLLDENGEPMPYITGYSVDFEDWQYQCSTPTEEDIALVLELISVAKPANAFGHDDSKIVNIICEEAAAYFSRQKTMDEVIEIIQNRVQLYVDENR